MKVWCKVRGQPAVVVGYAPAPKGKVLAIVISKGQLKAVRLKDIKLEDLGQWSGKKVKDAVDETS